MIWRNLRGTLSTIALIHGGENAEAISRSHAKSDQSFILALFNCWSLSAIFVMPYHCHLESSEAKRFLWRMIIWPQRWLTWYVVLAKLWSALEASTALASRCSWKGHSQILPSCWLKSFDCSFLYKPRQHSLQSSFCSSSSSLQSPSKQHQQQTIHIFVSIRK